MIKAQKTIIISIILLLVIFLSSCGIVNQFIGNKSDRTYNIHFNANGGTGVMDDYLVEKGDDSWLPKCEFTKEGYECIAWGMNAEGTSFATQIDNMTYNLPSSVKNGDTVQLYAIWTTPGFSFDLVTMGFFAHTKITGYSGNEKNIIIPAWFEGSYNESAYGSCGVNTINYGLFKDRLEIETIKNIPVSNLPNDLFNGCKSLKSVEVHPTNKIRSIGMRTFYNCSSLQEIELSNELHSISNEAFYMCTSIEKLVISSHIEEIGINVFYGWTENQTIEFTEYTENTFGDEWLNGCNAKIIWSGEK